MKTARRNPKRPTHFGDFESKLCFQGSRGRKLIDTQQAVKPCWTTYYNLGARFNRVMEPRCTLLELGKVLGTSRQSAYTESVVALGKLVYGLQQVLREEVGK